MTRNIDAGIRKIIKDGKLVGSRIYPLALPQRPTFPAVVYQRITEPGDYTLSGDTNWRFIRLQLTWYDDDYDDLRDLVDSANALLSGYTGTVGSFAKIQSCMLDTERDDADLEIGLWSTIQDWKITYSEV